MHAEMLLVADHLIPGVGKCVCHEDISADVEVASAISPGWKVTNPIHNPGLKNLKIFRRLFIL